MAGGEAVSDEGVVMGLSVCLVTRDAAARLPRVLGSVAAVADEVFVADTGSSDATVQIAQAHGARAEVMPWRDDFAEACNFALDRVRGDWVLWLNPDEELLPTTRADLGGYLARPDVLAYQVRVQEVPRGDRPDFFVETVQTRLFRRRPDLRFAGRLHPQLAGLADVARREGMQVPLAELAVRHHAYLSVLDPSKLRWAARLFERELQDRPGQLHYLIEYGRTLLRLNDPRGHELLAQAAEQVRARREDPGPPSGTVGSLLEYLLTVSPAQSRAPLSRAEAEELARRWFPDAPPLLWARAQNAFAAEDYAAAARHLEYLLELGLTGRYDRSAPFDPGLIGDTAVLNLAQCYGRLGELDRAEAAFRQLLNHPTYHPQAVQGLAWVGLRRQSPQAPPPGP